MNTSDIKHFAEFGGRAVDRGGVGRGGEGSEDQGRGHGRLSSGVRRPPITGQGWAEIGAVRPGSGWTVPVGSRPARLVQL